MKSATGEIFSPFYTVTLYLPKKKPPSKTKSGFNILTAHRLKLKSQIYNY